MRRRAAFAATLLALSAACLSGADDKVCATCHAAIYKNYQATPMARTSGIVDAANSPVADPVEFTGNGAQYKVNRDLSNVWLSEQQGENSGKQQLQYFIGSGEVGRSYAYGIDRFLFQAPVAHFSSTNQWALSPGFELSPQVMLTRPLETACLNCHASNLKALAGTRNGYEQPPFQPGISCERCHGLAEEHLARLKAGNMKTGSGIVNPAKLAGERRDSVCAQCHLSGAVRITKADGSDPYRPGGNLFESSSVFFWTDSRKPLSANSHFEQLTRSACWRRSRDTLWCGTCHDPHTVVPKAKQASYYRSRCETCHGNSAPACSASAAVRRQVQDNCIACHMATKPMVTVQHAAQTDHTIPRVARVAAIVNQSAETSLTPFPGTAPPERETALAYASAALEANNRALGMQAFEMLRALLPRLRADVTVADQLAQLYDKRGQSTEACRLFLDAANSDTAPTGALVNAGGCLAKADRLTEAMELWKKALRQNPAEEAARLNLAVALARSGEIAAARATLQGGLRFDPFFSKASQLLADLR